MLAVSSSHASGRDESTPGGSGIDGFFCVNFGFYDGSDVIGVERPCGCGVFM